MLEELPEREAEVVRLYHLRSMNYREIGKRLRDARGSVGPILSKARKRLKSAGRAPDRGVSIRCPLPPESRERASGQARVSRILADRR